MERNSFFCNLGLYIKSVLVLILLLGGSGSAWADTVIKTIDFSDSSWSDVTFSQGASDDPETINGVTFNSKSGSYHFSLSDGVLTFPNYNMTTNNYALGFPVTGIVGGIVIIKVYNGTDASQVKYAIKDGGTAFNTSDMASGTPAPTFSTPCTIINTGLSDSKAYIYIGRNSSSYKTITKIEVLTVESTDLSESSFYSLYKSGYTSVANLISGASFPSYIFTNIGTSENTSVNSSEVLSPHDFSGLSSASSSTYYYRLKTSNSNTIAIGALSHVKSIRLYGNGTGYDGIINVNAINVSGSGDAISKNINYENSKQTVLEYSTGNLSEIEGYDIDTYYFYTITFAGKSSSSTNFSLWGLYIEYNEPSSYTVTYDVNGGSGTILNSTGASITLSDGTGFNAPTGYTFAGWNTDPHGEGTSYTSGQTGVKADLTLYAVWTQNGTIDDNGGSADGAYTATYNKASIEITTAPTYAGHIITGYYVEGTGEDLIAADNGVLQASTAYTNASGYWTYTDAAPTLYAQWENSHTVTVEVNDDDMGSAEANDDIVIEGGTTTVTATANDGYKFRSWDVSDGDNGAELSSTTANPTTLTIGTADVTVTATFSALEKYTITYHTGENGSGAAISNGKKTEDEDFILSSSTYSRSGYIQIGWALSDGGDKAYELGGTYTDNANLDLYPYWTEQYTITYDKNGGSNFMIVTTGTGEVTLRENSFIKSGYTFLGWATSQEDANAGIVSYADKAIYLLTADVTLYAVWGENYCEMKPVTSGTAPNVGNTISMQSEANVFGGKMTVYAATGGLSYSSNGLQSGGGYTATLDIELNNYMKPGSIIVLTIHSLSSGTERGYNLYSSDGNNKIATLTTTNINSTTIQYKVKADDGLDGTKGFKLVKANTNLIYLKSLYVIDCQPGGVIPESGWSTYSCNKALDLSTISGGTAYIATTVNNSENNVIVKTCNNIVEAGTGLMIKGTAGSIFTINTTTEASNLNKTNLLVGLPNGGTAPEGSYVFGWPTGKSEEYGFYYINSTEPTLGLGKAYLTSPIASSNGAKLRISFDDEENTTTDIQNAKELKQQNREFFNLQGQRVLTPKKGLYVSKGKIIFNK